MPFINNTNYLQNLILMKKYFYIPLLVGSILFWGNSCSSDDDLDFNEGGQETQIVIEDGKSLPAGEVFWGDSIMSVKSLPATKSQVVNIKASTTESGKISVLGGYEENAVYVYAKGLLLSKERTQKILDRYYNVVIESSGTEIEVNITRRTDTVLGSDFRSLTIYAEIYTTSEASTNLDVKHGDMYVYNVKGATHKASSTTGAIRYNTVKGDTFNVTSKAGYVAFTNTIGTNSMTAKLDAGSINFALPRDSKAALNLTSSINISYPILTSSNYKGTKSRKAVKGDLNGSGCKINADIKLGSIQLLWYK